MKLPYPDQRFIQSQKITHYLLGEGTEAGRAKAEFFRAFGFDEVSLELALHFHPDMHDVVDIITVPDGTKYVIEGNLPSPNGRDPCVRTIWKRDKGGETSRLIAAYPREDALEPLAASLASEAERPNRG